MNQTIVVQITDENNNLYTIGAVYVPAEMSVEDAEQRLHELWEEWRIAVPTPDSESQFVEWLMQYHWDDWAEAPMPHTVQVGK